MITNPALRYHGSKWRIAKWIISHFPVHKIYCEPFGGSASVLIKKKLSKIEVYNDLDGNVVNFFRVLRDPVKAKRLIDLLALTPYARDEYDLAFEKCDDDIEMARRLVVKSYFGFGSNAGTRRSKCGFRSNDWTARKANNLIWLKLPESLIHVVHRFKNVIIENLPAAAILEKQDSERTLFYIDPPYVHSTRTSFAKDRSYMHEMTDEDHAALARQLKSLKGMVIVSGYRSDLYDDLYREWTRKEKLATTQGNSTCLYRKEYLWISPNAERSSSQKVLF